MNAVTNARQIIRTATIACLLLLLSASLWAQSPKLGIPFGHTTPVTSLQLSPEGTLISSSQDALIFHWDLQKRKLLRSVPGPYSLYLGPASADGIAYGNAVNPAFRKGGEFVKLNTGESIDCEFTFRGNAEVIGMGYFSLGKGTVSRDGEYFLEDGQLTPGCVRGGDTIQLDFPAQGFVPGGDFLYQFTDSSMQRWVYPELTAVEDIILEDSFLQNVPVHFLGPGKYIYQTVASADRETADHHIWNLQTSKKIGIATLPADRKISDVHPSEQYLLVHGFTKERRRKILEQRYNLEKGLSYKKCVSG